jgi:hypothetical protein
MRHDFFFPECYGSKEPLLSMVRVTGKEEMFLCRFIYTLYLPEVLVVLRVAVL